MPYLSIATRYAGSTGNTSDALFIETGSRECPLNSCHHNHHHGFLASVTDGLHFWDGRFQCQRGDHDRIIQKSGMVRSHNFRFSRGHGWKLVLWRAIITKKGTEEYRESSLILIL